MKRIGFSKIKPYSKNREMRESMIDWIEGLGCDYFLTFEINNCWVDTAEFETLINEWSNRIDRAALDRNWHKEPKGTLLVGFFEDPGTNLHLHAVVQLPVTGKPVSNERMQKIWEYLTSTSGSLDIQKIKQRRNVAAYISKQLVKGRFNLDNMVIRRKNTVR